MGKSKKSIAMRSRALNHREIRRGNNKAVKKTREKKKFQQGQTLTQINLLKAENEGLEVRIQNLREQLDSLKKIYYEQQRAKTETMKAAEVPVIKTEPLDMETDGDGYEEYEIDGEKYDKLRQILHEVNILNNS